MENELQDTKFLDLKDFLSLKFETMGKDIARLDGKYTELERKNCLKHDLILSTFNHNNGKLEEKIDSLREKVITREQFDRYIESQTGRNMMIQKDIKDACEDLENLRLKDAEIEGKIKNILIYFSIIGTAIVIGIDIARKRLGI